MGICFLIWAYTEPPKTVGYFIVNLAVYSTKKIALFQYMQMLQIIQYGRSYCCSSLFSCTNSVYPCTEYASGREKRFADGFPESIPAARFSFHRRCCPPREAKRHSHREAVRMSFLYMTVTPVERLKAAFLLRLRRQRVRGGWRFGSDQSSPGQTEWGIRRDFRISVQARRLCPGFRCPPWVR